MYTDLPTWRLFWAKTLPRKGEKRSEAENTHPLWAHLLDVANVAQVLWSNYLPASLRTKMAETLNLTESQAGRFLSFWIGLHDTGKAISGFQALHTPTADQLKERGVPLESDGFLHHGHASIALLVNWLEKRNIPGAQRPLLFSLAGYAGFHHGRLWSQGEWVKHHAALGEKEEWRTAQHDLVEKVESAWSPPLLDEAHVSDQPFWLLGFAGWASVADWIGSMEKHFAGKLDTQPGDDLNVYCSKSREAAEEAVRAVGIQRPAALRKGTYQDLFEFIDTPRLLQRKTAQLEVSSDTPSLTIVEAPTGIGKTEAALHLAARQQHERSGGGLYVAMPTQSTANGLYPRLKDFLKRAHTADTPANVTLLHGNADLHPDRQRLTVPDVEETHEDDDRSGDARTAAVQTRRWFLPKRRGLLAPYGIGTVDQAHLGVLFSKHFFVRLFGLAGKTVVFDEVHAYDTYMSELFLQLLRWLRALGTNVIVLSATLPDATRRQMIEAWDATDPSDGAPKYPAITHVTENGVDLRDDFPEPEEKDQKQTQVRWHSPDLTEVAGSVREAVSKGATVAVIVNTVRRAQRLCRELFEGEDALDLSPKDRWLLHARFPHGRRAKLESCVMTRFGKNRVRRPGVLIATQVAEQSLDLDVDVMFSDLAPIDLLLQREGRLHRHARWRQLGYERPRLYVLCPGPPEEGFPNTKKVAPIYDEYTLFATWHLLDQRDGWTLPGDYRDLVEGVYGDRLPGGLTGAQREALDEAEEAFRDKCRAEEGEASNRLVVNPEHISNLLTRLRPTLAEDDEEDVHDDFRAMTRLGEPSIECVCLHRGADSTLYFDATHEEEAPAGPALDVDGVRRLLKAAVRISHRGVTPFLLENDDEGGLDEPEWWTAIRETNATLCRHRLLVFENGEWTAHPRYRLRLDETLGLIIEKK